MEAFGVTGAAEHVLGRTIIMADRLALDIPHRLGRAEARQKLENKLGHIAAALPGGSLNSHHWEGDTLFLDIAVLGQRIASELEVLDDRVHAGGSPAFWLPVRGQDQGRTEQGRNRYPGLSPGRPGACSSTAIYSTKPGARWSGRLRRSRRTARLAPSSAGQAGVTEIDSNSADGFGREHKVAILLLVRRCGNYRGSTRKKGPAASFASFR